MMIEDTLEKSKKLDEKVILEKELLEHIKLSFSNKDKELQLYLIVSKIRQCLHYLKKYRTIKKFYTTRIRTFMNNSHHRILETIFLEWKLIHMKKLHMNYQSLSLLSLRRATNFNIFIK